MRSRLRKATGPVVETTLVRALGIACVGRRTEVIGADFVRELGDASIGAAIEGLETAEMAETDRASQRSRDTDVSALARQPKRMGTSFVRLNMQKLSKCCGRGSTDHTRPLGWLEDARATGVEEVVLSSWAFNESAHEAFRRWGSTPRVIEFSLLLG
jgi:hypothetical protein